MTVGRWKANHEEASIEALSEEWTLELPEGPWSLQLTPLGESRYRVEEIPSSLDSDTGLIVYHDVIEAETTAWPRRLRFVRVLERSQEMLEILIPRDFFESPELRALLDWVTKQGGGWALDMRALLLVSLPSQAKPHFLSEYGRIAATYNGSR